MQNNFNAKKYKKGLLVILVVLLMSAITCVINRFCFLPTNNTLVDTNNSEISESNAEETQVVDEDKDNQTVEFRVPDITTPNEEETQAVVNDKNNPIVEIGYSDMIKQGAQSTVYNKNKLLIVRKDKFEVFDIDKREIIKKGTIKGLKYGKESRGKLLPINNNEVLMIELLEFHPNEEYASEYWIPPGRGNVFGIGILNLKDFSYTRIGEYTMDNVDEELIFEYEKGKYVFIPDLGSKAYIFDKDKNKIESFSVENIRRNFGNLIRYKDKYFVIYSSATEKDMVLLINWEQFSPLIEEFNPVKKTLTTVYKQGFDTDGRYINTVLYKNGLMIYDELHNPYCGDFLQTKLRGVYFDINRGKIIEERIFVPPYPKEDIPDIIYRSFSIPGILSGDYLDNGNVIIYEKKADWSPSGKILLYQDDKARKLSK